MSATEERQMREICQAIMAMADASDTLQAGIRAKRRLRRGFEALSPATREAIAAVADAVTHAGTLVICDCLGNADRRTALVHSRSMNGAAP